MIDGVNDEGWNVVGDAEVVDVPVVDEVKLVDVMAVGLADGVKVVGADVGAWDVVVEG